MKTFIPAALGLATMLSLPCSATQAAPDLANGERINRNCALCHGIYGQGAAGQLSPRLAGLPQVYLEKATKEFRENKRINPLMVATSGLHQMTNQDIEDVSAYLASLDIGKDMRFNVEQRMPGNPMNGQQLFKDSCTDCHGEDGLGKPKKKSPPLAGQQSEYIFQSIQMFKAKVRNHDNDPDDETFKDLQDPHLLDIIAYVATLDDKRIVPGEHFRPPHYQMASRPAHAAPQPVPPPRKDSGLMITDITQTVAQMALKDGVTKEAAIQAMLSKAVEINMKLVGRQDVSKELEARGVESPFLSIFQFCNPMDARTMVIHNPIFSSYMPCRISLVEDKNGKAWLMMLNLDMLINSDLLPQAVVDTAIKVNQQMLDIMVAGATGEF